MRFSCFEHPDGYETSAGNCVLYDVAAGVAHAGAASVAGRALRFELGEHDRNGAKLTIDVELDAGTSWLVRCDRVDFPPGAVAWRHVHPGPGIRCLLAGEVRLTSSVDARVVEPFQAWFEGVDDPVVVAASPIAAASLVRVLVLPAEWAGERTIRYLDPADEGKPHEQTAATLLEVPVLS